jgi:replicative DNA helicase
VLVLALVVDVKERPQPGIAWEAPVPLPAQPAPPAFPVNVLAQWARDWVVGIAEEKGASPDIGANLLIAVVAGALSRHIQVWPRRGWEEPPNMYLITALVPGQRKTPVFKEALRPVRTLEMKRRVDWRKNAKAAELALKLHDKQERDLLQQAESGADPTVLVAQLGERPVEVPPCPRLVTEDVTPEGLAALLADHGRMIAASDEGAALFENLGGRYTRGSTSWDLFNKAHSGADLAVDRKGSEPMIVFDPALTLAITTQPMLVRSLADKPGTGERGVLARVLYSMPTPVYADGPTPAMAPEVLREYARRIKNLYDDVPELGFDDEGHPKPISLSFAADAQSVFESWEKRLSDECRNLSVNEGASVYLGWLSKLAGQTARLAAVLHAAEYWSGGAGTPASTIDIRTVDSAIQLAIYYRAHARIAFALIGRPAEQRLALTILDWLRERGSAEREGLTLREIHRTRTKGTAAAEVRAALRLLEEHGFVHVERQQTSQEGGRPSEHVYVHPSLQPDRTDKTTPSRTFVGFVSPVCGDPDFPEWIDQKFHEGFVTKAEWLGRRRLQILLAG